MTQPGQQRAETIPVTVDNFVRAETDRYFGSTVRGVGLGRLFHRREIATVERQPVIRMNRDTLYSSVVFDLDAGAVTISLPDAGRRYLSLQVISQDHHTPLIAHDGGAHRFDRAMVGTRYCIATIRILVDPEDEADVAQAIALQDAVTVEQVAGGRFEVPLWDRASQKAVRDALLAVAATLPDLARVFGAKGQVDPVRHLLGAAAAWGGLPEWEATYLNVVPAHNDGRTVYRLEVGDVPADGFWSISVYNAGGYFEPNPLNAYAVNSLTAKRAADGRIPVQFGGCDGTALNCLPIVAGWNYIVRLYRPRPEVLDGTWRFPEARPVNEAA